MQPGLRSGLAQALIAVDPQMLFLLEGTSQDCCINGMSYGNGFATSVPYISQFQGGGGATFQSAAFSTPDDFLTALATDPSLIPVLDRTIISPHVYGPNVSGKAAWHPLTVAALPALLQYAQRMLALTMPQIRCLLTSWPASFQACMAEMSVPQPSAANFTVCAVVLLKERCVQDGQRPPTSTMV